MRKGESRIQQTGYQSGHTDEVIRHVVKGAFALGARQLVVHGTNVLGNIILARLLAPSEYGIYAIINFFILFLGAFGGTGLAANLIREHPEPSQDVYRTVYTFQQVFVFAVSVVLWLSASHITVLYHLDPKLAWLFRLTAFSLIATVWMVPSQIAMERQLSFQKLAVVESVQSICFNVLAVTLAWRGFGAMSFGIALLIRSVAGAILANAMQPVSHCWLLDWKLAKPHLRFGLFYQSSQIVSLVKDSITPMLIGFMVGTAGVGYISWAAMTAAYPVLALMVLQRLYLPSFAKFQHDPAQFGVFIQQVIWATNAIAAPLAIILLVLVHPITLIIFGAKWEAAIPLFYFFWIANIFVPTATPVQSLLNAIGRADLATVFAVMWMVLTWGFGWPLAATKGILGIAIATALVQLSNLVLFRTAQRFIPFRILGTVYTPWLLACGAGVLLHVIIHFVPVTNVPTLVASAMLTFLAYAVAFASLHRKRIARLYGTVMQR
jgi:O-antigen/teichoic acid export membrane protein